MAGIEWGDIQGNILRGYGFDHARHLVLSVASPVEAREWLASQVPAITPATPWTVRPETTLNIAFTHRGLAAFGVGPELLATFPTDFQEGMRVRAADHLGDVGPDSPGGWEPCGVHDPAAHVLVMVYAASAERADAAADDARRTATASGLELISTERLANLIPEPGRYPGPAPPIRRMEHFGFADGISQPAVDGAVEPTIVRGNGTPLDDGGWRTVQPGEFVLGYRDEEEAAPPLPSPRALVANGSFLVYRKLAQDVAAFRRMLTDQAARHQIDPVLLGAKLVGRRADGTPFRLADAGSSACPVPPATAADLAALNDVRFGADGRGLACPVSSHIRRANPRDAFGMQPELVSRHRLLRRGMPFGPPLPDDASEDDDIPRGLLFVAYCASIQRQFELVQREWLNDGNVFGVGNSPDPIAGHGDAPRRFLFDLPDRPPAILGELPRLVRTLGGEYLFQPGLTGLRHLAASG